LDRFLSHYTNRFDAKGRLSVPASFRAVLTRDGFDGIFIHPSLDSPALDCGGSQLLSEVNALLDSMPPYSQEREDLATALFGTGEIVRADSEGRILLGERIRASLDLRDEAVFVGHGHKFQIWEPNRFATHLEEAKSRVRRMRAEFGARAAQAVSQRARE
jgi:MraZ protein